MDEVKDGIGERAETVVRRSLIGGSEAARRRAARVIAIAVDLLQIVVFPVFFPGIVSPVNNVVDVATGVVMVLLLGWHVAFLPTFIAEVVPFVDLFPTWTLAVLFVTRKKKLKPSPAPGSPR